MSKIITPTVGRKVLYRPSESDFKGPIPMAVVKDQPLDATVIAVWGDRMVNVDVIDITGRHFPVLSCDLLQEGDEPNKDANGKTVGRYCEWMPYQLGQAKKEAA